MSKEQAIKITKGKMKVIVTELKNHIIELAEQDGYSAIEGQPIPKVIHHYLEPPKRDAIEDVFKEMVFSLQNRRMVPTVIKDREEEPPACFFDYSPEKIYRYMTTVGKFRKAMPKQLRRNGKALETLLVGILDAAAWFVINDFKDMNSFKKYVKRFEKFGIEGAWMLAGYLGCGIIRGMGFATAMNFLKESGTSIAQYCCKPDVHIKETLIGLGVCDIKDRDIMFVRKIDEMAKMAELSNYALDKLIWLANSGFFYDHKVPNSKWGKRIRLVSKSISKENRNRLVDRIRRRCGY